MHARNLKASVVSSEEEALTGFCWSGNEDVKLGVWNNSSSLMSSKGDKRACW